MTTAESDKNMATVLRYLSSNNYKCV